jgi:hypothetical protein
MGIVQFGFKTLFYDLFRLSEPQVNGGVGPHSQRSRYHS